MVEGYISPASSLEEGELRPTRAVLNHRQKQKMEEDCDNLTEHHSQESDIACGCKDIDRFQCFPIERRDYFDPFREQEVDSGEEEANRGHIMLQRHYEMRSTMPSSAHSPPPRTF